MSAAGGARSTPKDGGDGGGANAWRTNAIGQAQLDAAGLTLSSQVEFRFTANDSDPQSIVEAGVDAFKVEGVICNAACYADCDGNGSLDFFDFLCYQNEFQASCP